MKALLFIAALLSACALQAAVATSDNYAIVAQAIDGGGGPSTSADYGQDLGVIDIAGRSVATSSDVITYGFIALLNNPPIAVDDLRSHPFDQAVDIPTTAIFSNDFDPDNDGLRLLRWDAITAHGGSVSLVGTALRYSPPAGLTGEDHFTYTVADPSGDIAIATIHLLVAPSDANQPLNTVAAFALPDGKILLRFKQTAGAKEYRIQYRPDLRGTTFWQDLSSSKSADGIVELEIDPNQADQGYFRALAIF